jgi:hypothetical protein
VCSKTVLLNTNVVYLDNTPWIDKIPVYLDTDIWQVGSFGRLVRLRSIYLDPLMILLFIIYHISYKLR